MSDKKGSGIQGEGDYASARRYDEATKQFVEDGKVGPAARRARTDDPAEQAELQRAEDAGRARAKEEDRLLEPGAEAPQVPSGRQPSPAADRSGTGGRPGQDRPGSGRDDAADPGPDRDDPRGTRG